MRREPFTILGLAGSLRRQSYKRALLRVASAVAPAHGAVQIFDLAALPLFNDPPSRHH